jgi:hypothetical protein
LVGSVRTFCKVAFINADCAFWLLFNAANLCAWVLASLPNILALLLSLISSSKEASANIKALRSSAVSLVSCIVNKSILFCDSPIFS